MANYELITGQATIDRIVSPQTGITFLHYSRQKLASIVSYVWEGQLQLHNNFLQAMGVLPSREIHSYEISFLKGFSAASIGNHSLSACELGWVWHNLALLNDFYWGTSLEVLLLTIRAFKVRLFSPRFLPNLIFLAERLKDRFHRPSEPINQKNMDAAVSKAVDSIKQELPGSIIELGETAWFLCSEGFLTRLEHPPIIVADRKIHLRGAKRNQIQALIWLLHLLEDQKNMRQVGEFLLKALKARVRETIDHIEQWYKNDVDT